MRTVDRPDDIPRPILAEIPAARGNAYLIEQARSLVRFSRELDNGQVVSVMFSPEDARAVGRALIDAAGETAAAVERESTRVANTWFSPIRTGIRIHSQGASLALTDGQVQKFQDWLDAGRPGMYRDGKVWKIPE